MRWCGSCPGRGRAVGAPAGGRGSVHRRLRAVGRGAPGQGGDGCGGAAAARGVDERLLRRRVDEEVSIGDFVLSGGELAAMALMDAVVRQLPGALGDENSALEESFADGLLDCPQYTRPEAWMVDGAGLKVPEVL